MLTIDHTQGNQTRLNWLLYDGHGNLVRVMASDYTLSGFQWRGVWGEVQSSLGAGRGYCANLGHSEDETGLVYMRARYYEPLTGRFISEDPARDGVNWYLYADGNPVGKVDNDGHKSIIENIFAMIVYDIIKFVAKSVWNSGVVQNIFNRVMLNAALLPVYMRLRLGAWIERLAWSIIESGVADLDAAFAIAESAEGIPNDWVRFGTLMRAAGYAFSGVAKLAVGVNLRHLSTWLLYLEE